MRNIVSLVVILPLLPLPICQWCTCGPGLSDENAAVGTYFRVFLVVMLLRPDPSSHQMVTDRVRQGEVIIALG